MKEDRGYEKLYRDMIELPQEEKLIELLEQEEIEKFLEETEIIEPPANIDEFIFKGARKGRKTIFRKQIRLAGTLAAVFASIFFVSMIYISPAFAKSVSNIPGLSYIVEMVYGDKGLEAAVEKDFVIRVNKTVEKQDISITLKDVIVDTSKAEIFYEIVNESEIYNGISIDDLEFFDQSGNKLIFSYDMYSMPIESHDKDVRTLSVHFLGSDTEIPEEFNLSIKIKNQDYNEDGSIGEKIVLKDTWKFSFNIDKDKLLEMVEEREIKKTIGIEGQKVRFKKARITPTLISLEMEMPEDNTKKLLTFEDIEIVNEKGVVWGRPQGVTGAIGENELTLYFQSSYFSDSKELYVRGSAVRALDKDKLEVIFDLDKEEVVKAPDSTLHFEIAERSEDSTTINFTYEDRLPKLYSKDGEEINTGYFIFQHDIIDDRGELLEIASMSNYGAEPNEGVLRSGAITIDTDKELQGTITLRINDYPARIQEEFKVRIK